MILIRKKITGCMLAFFMLICNFTYGFDKPIRLVASPALENNLVGPVIINTNASQLVQLAGPSATSFDKEVIGTVQLQVKTNAAQYSAPIDAEISLLITTYNAAGNIISNATNILKVNHQPFTNSAYKDQDYVIFNNQANKIYKIVTQITQIKINNAIVNSLPDNLLIESTIDYLRYNQFTYNAPIPAPTLVSVDQDGDAIDDVLEITWSPMNGAVHYELEYTSINDYDISSGINISNIKSPTNLSFDFKNNSTRIVTFANSYTVPLIFDRGYFLCRIRGFGKDISGTNPSLLPINGNWSFNSNAGTIAAFTAANSAWLYISNHFEIKKNWQYNSTFAEEGKHKDVINYADGSLRSRQTITKINSDNTTILGENVYDYTGRSAVNILPVPLPKIIVNSNIGSSSFLYKTNFNISDNTNNKFSKEDFDLDNTGDICNPSSAGLATNSGASKYYSQANPDKDGYQAFVPDAQKFPFTQVEYTPDNTGRIKKQSGVGINHKLGSNHETKYFYGGPEQIELDRLFGSEVGNASHYQKNMVIDANGQVSITYMDMEGKTIATSLAGSAPSNMLNMPKQPVPAVGLTADMFNKNALGESENNLVNASADEITFNKSILVSDNNTPNVFTYSMSIGKFIDPCLNSNICFNCVYDFEMKIVDDCGNVKYSTVTGGKKMIGRFNVVNSDTLFTTACYNPVTYNYVEATLPALNLQAGVYYVSKTLKINKDARDFYLKEYLNPANSCILGPNVFLQNELNKIDTTDCFVSCSSCFKSLGTKDNYVSLGKGTEEEWEIQYEECKSLCGYPKTPCEISLGILLVDVSPNGQYGEYLTPNDPLSVYNPANLLPKNIATIPAPIPPLPNPTQLNMQNNINNGPVTANATPQAYWKKPVYYKTNALQYLDKKGKRFKVILTKIPNGPNPGNYSYALDNLALVIATNTVGIYYTYPENLTNLDDFISVWQASFAKSLVTYHPEFCYYEDCIYKFSLKILDTISSNDYDAKLLFTKSLQGAINKQLVVSNGNGGYKLNLLHDPVNKPGYFSPVFTNNPSLLEQKYLNYDIVNSPALRLDQFVSYTFKCGTQFASNLSATSCTNFGFPIVGTPTQIIDMQDKEWNALKAIYFGEKQKLIYEYSNGKRLSSTTGCNYYNACIGDPNFDGYSTPMVKYLPGNILNQTSAYFNAKQPCNQIIKDLYVNKVKRFGFNKEDESVDENEIAYQSYLQTGKCPMALDLQNLMHALAQNGKLKNTTEALQNYPQMTINFYNYINNATPAPTPYTSYLSVGQLLSGNVLHIDFKKAIGNTTVKFIEFNQPFPNIANFSWSNVQGVSQFMQTGPSAPIETFSCTVQVLIGSTLYYKTVTGTTDIKLDGCMFKDICKPNDLAKQLQNVMSALKASGNFQNTSPYTLGAPSGNTFYGPYLQKTQQLIGQNAVTPNLQWQNVSNANFSYALFDATTPNCKLQINLLTINNNPISSPITLLSIYSFKKIRSDYQNFFTMEARDVNNALVGIIKGEVFKICGGPPIPISMGTCDKPDPASCKTPFHKNQKDLEILLKDILETQKYWPNANAIVSNVVTNVNLTNNLIGNFQPLNANIPTTKYVVANNFHRVLSGELVNNSTLNNDSVVFVLKSPCIVPTPTVDPNPNPNAFMIQQAQIPPPPPCVETTYCKVWLKTNNKSIAGGLDLNNLTAVKKLVGCGNIVNNNYTDFYLLVDYTYNNAIISDTLFGNSCFELQNCNPCKDDLNSCCGSNSNAQPGPIQPNPIQIDSNAIVVGIAKVDSSLVSYADYTTKVSALNTTMGWTSNDTSYIQPITYIEMKTKGYEQVLNNYNEFIVKFDTTIDNRMYLKNISHFAKDYGFSRNPMKAYKRYLKATNKYNIKALAISANTISPIADTTFYKNFYLDSINVYIDYLLAAPAPSVNTQSAPAFFAARAGLPGPDPCSILYNNYVNAYMQFINNPAIICENPPPLFSYTQFTDNGYCCPPNYTAFTNYINSFYTANACPPILLTKLDNCVVVNPPDIKECASLYNLYLAAVGDYNISVYAVNNNAYLNNNLFADINSFYQQGFCNCATSYITYLNQYINALPNAVLSPPVSIKNWQGCGPGTGTDVCDVTYNNYLAASNDFLSWQSQNPFQIQYDLIIYNITEFTYSGLCYCVPGYISFLNAVMSGAITNPTYISQNLSINAFCNQKPIVCPNPNALDTVVSPPVPPTQNPCAKYKKDLAKANAALAYQQYIQAQTTLFITNYNKYCLSATESLTRDYSSREFHYTLYYYDQAGNLIRTIPPEGLDVGHYTSIISHLSANAIKAKNDRTYKTKTLFTKHGMATTYLYNSLNQLIKQKMPDHEALTYMKYKYNYGLDTAMTVVTSQFPDKAKGYLGGNEVYNDPIIGSFTRGKIFESTDASLSWKPLGNITGSDLKKVQFLTANGNDYGFGVGSDGAFVFSIDGGVNWDYYPIHEFTNGNSDLNDVYFYQSNNNTIQGILVGDNGTAVKVKFNLGNVNINIYNDLAATGNFSTNDNITDITADNANNPNFYITVLNKTTNTSKIYSSNGNGTSANWLDITDTRLPNLNKVRQLKTTSNFYAVGSDGNLIKSSDNGNTWVVQETNTALNFADVYFATANAGVAILQDVSLTGSLYKTSDGGNNWVLFDAGTPTKNYKTLSPYANLASTTIDKLTANGTSGLVKRITINYTTANTIMVGAVTTTIATANQINDVCIVPYNVVSAINYKQLAVAVGNNGLLQYCTDYTQNNPTWMPVTGSTQNFSKVLFDIQNPSTNPSINGIVLDNIGNVRPLTSNVITSALPLFTVLNNINQGVIKYNDMVYDLNNTNIYSTAFLIGKNINNGNVRFANIGFQNPITIGTTPNLFNSNPNTTSTVTSLVVKGDASPNPNSDVILAVGTNGDITKGTTGTIGTSASNPNLNTSDKSNNLTPVMLNDILLDPFNSKIAVVGNDGYYAEKIIGGTTPFQIKNTKTASDITAAKYVGQFLGSIYFACSKQGEFITLASASAANNATAINTTVTNTPLNDIDVKNTGTSFDSYLVGDNGSAFLRTNTNQITQVYTPTSENLNSASFYPSNNNVFVVGNLTTGIDIYGVSSSFNRNWYTNEINKLHFTDTYNGYFVGMKGLIRHTNDGGFTWRTVKPPYLNQNNNNPIDLFAVYTTALDKAVIAGGNNYISNVTNLNVAATPILGGTGQGNQTWYDIDMADINGGFIVGSNLNTTTAKVATLTLVNDLVSTQATIPSSTNGEGLKAVYAFKDDQAGKFIAVGENRTLKIYNGTTFSSINYAAAPNNLNSVFNPTDIIYDIDFSDNTTGYLVGSRSRFVSIDVDLISYSANLKLKLPIAPSGPPPPGYTAQTNNTNYRTISLIDEASGFFGGNRWPAAPTLAKIAWKFLHEKGQTSTLFWYDRLGRLVLSQNTKQINKVPKAYSYTLYDALGRITEVGEKAENAVTNNLFDNIFGTYVGLYYNTVAINDLKLDNWIQESTGLRTDVTHTFYDNPYFTAANCPLPATFIQDNIRKRVASVTFEDVFDFNPCTYNHATHYTYDIHGNVKTLLQDNKAIATPANNPIASQRFKRIDYDYDLISGKVNQVSYQAGEPDAFHHQYEYDDDNRITEVKTSRNGNVWETDAKYFYYKHGPLARTEYGHDKVQGMDYAYTLQGWIKGVNSNKLTSNNDIGKDGDGPATLAANLNKNKLFAQDATGYTLGYFNSDYSAIDNTLWASANRFEAVTGGSSMEASRNNLYNGNISYMATSIVQPLNLTGPLANNYLLNPLPAGNAYKYDQVNRIREATHFENLNTGTNTWDAAPNAVANQYKNFFTYDDNGNILNQIKHDGNGNLLDNINYNYNTSGLVGGKLKQNRLYSIEETAPVTAIPDDIETPGYNFNIAEATINTANNYSYDEIGNLTKDVYEEISSIKWTVYGKIKEINRPVANNKKSLKFDYDATGNRIAKHVYSGTIWESSTYYVRDAQGNVMGIYKNEVACINCPNPIPVYGLSYKLIERNIYGSSRIGTDEHTYELLGANYNSTVYERIVGNKQFELSNHLGNVLTVVSDRKIPVTVNNTITDHFLPQITMATDYYAFGSPKNLRQFNLASAQVGFNGKEKDDEVKGTGNSLDYGARIYDPRIGRWLSIDPKSYKYPYLSTYAAFGNSPNYYIDPGGETLRVAITGNVDADLKSKNDIVSLLPDGKSTLIDFTSDGTVKFNVSMAQAKALAAKDPGIGLVYDLVVANETIVYQASESSAAMQDGKVVNLDLFAPINNNPSDFQGGRPITNNIQVDNQSITSKGDADMKDRQPIESGVDGKVVIDPDLSFVGNENGSGAKKNREAIVFHELSENYERTVGKKNFDDAHNAANTRQDKMQPSDRRRDGKSGTATFIINGNTNPGNDGKNKTSKPIKS